MTDEAVSAPTSEVDAKQQTPGSTAFANEVFSLIGHENIHDITALQADMYVCGFPATPHPVPLSTTYASSLCELFHLDCVLVQLRRFWSTW